MDVESISNFAHRRTAKGMKGKQMEENDVDEEVFESNEIVEPFDEIVGVLEEIIMGRRPLLMDHCLFSWHIYR